MTNLTRSPLPSARLYGIGVAAVAIVDLAIGTFDPSQPVPDSIPGRSLLAFGASAFLLLAGAGVTMKRTSANCAAALAIYFAIVVAFVMNGAAIVSQPIEYGSFFGCVEGVALAAAGAVIFAATGEIDRTNTVHLTRAAQLAFGLCAIFFGGAHFVYPGQTIPLVPKWIPPSQTFWAYATGLFHIAGGLAILTGIRARLAAILLAVMYAAFTPLVHLPLLLSDPAKHFYWTENALNLALIGTAWVIADSFMAQRKSRL
jgi:uncharacterized membrane protein